VTKCNKQKEGGLSQTHMEFQLKKRRKKMTCISMITNFAASFPEALVHFSALLTQSEKSTQTEDFAGMQLFRLKGRREFFSSLGS
jgi:hypothetical protein